MGPFCQGKKGGKGTMGHLDMQFLLDFVQAQLEVHQLNQGQAQLI